MFEKNIRYILNLVIQKVMTFSITILYLYINQYLVCLKCLKIILKYALKI